MISPGRQSRAQRQRVEPNQAERPYRSHLQPACTPCRRRKSRCQTEAGSDSCLTCRAHRTECFFPGDSRLQRAPESARQRRRSDILTASSHVTARAHARHGQVQEPSFQASSGAQAQTPMARPAIFAMGHRNVVASTNTSSNVPLSRDGGPMPGFLGQDEESPLTLDSRDNQQLNLHIVGPAVINDSQVLSDYLSGIPGATRSTRMIIPEPAGHSKPVLFTMVQKRPVGLTVNRSPSAEKLETIEKLLEPHTGDIIDE